MVPTTSLVRYDKRYATLDGAVRDVMPGGFGTGFLGEVKALQNRVCSGTSQECP